MKTGIAFKSLSEPSLDAGKVNGAPALSLSPSLSRPSVESVRDAFVQRVVSASADAPRLEYAGMASHRPRRVRLPVEFRKTNLVPVVVSAAVPGWDQREQIEKH